MILVMSTYSSSVVILNSCRLLNTIKVMRLYIDNVDVDVTCEPWTFNFSDCRQQELKLLNLSDCLNVLTSVISNTLLFRGFLDPETR